MDPLTHTLVGANLAATRLGGKTKLGAAALIIGANLPDVDSIFYFTGQQDFALWFRRGWTHGVLALVLLPVIQAAVLKLIDRSADLRWLLALSYLAIATHPMLDWLNTYGMRWLMPFRGTWFYGDAVYIMDPWLWLILGCGWLIGRKPSPWLIGVWLFFTGAILWVVGRRNGQYMIVVAIVAAILLVALLWKSKRSFATVALIVAAVYIGGRLTLSAATAMQVRASIPGIERVMTSPHPIDPTRWDVVAEVGDVYRYGRYTWLDRRLELNAHQIPVAKPSPEWSAAHDRWEVAGFLNWNRFPWYEVHRDAQGVVIEIHDARSAPRRRPGQPFSGVRVVLSRPLPRM
ncbi:MAG TPA: metal-dependent hydrolase [Thermoanaerobaculia bacterium]|nr:metal-dependent hydrolase [Thermoanaerobaculia bacterium]